MSITKETPVGELVALDYRTASVFKKNRIDFCCNGHNSLQEACEKKNLSADTLISELEAVMSQSKNTSIDYSSWPLDLLADYVEKKHHRYVEQKSQEILPYLEKIIRVHGSNHPELAHVGQLFTESVGELAKHMKKEEIVLFPAIREMVQNPQEASLNSTTLEKLKATIETMLSEHDAEGQRFEKIAELTKGYSVPEDGCNTYRVTLAMLEEFEDDLHLHIHLENNILFPKSISLADSLVMA